MTITREQLDGGKVDFGGLTNGKRLKPVHPGRILKKDFLEPLKLSAYALAKATGVAPIRISQILRAQRGITADTALLLARFFGTSADLWMGLQAQYDLETAVRASGTKSRLAKIEPYAGVVA